MSGTAGDPAPGTSYDRTIWITSSGPAGRVCQRVYNDETICSPTGGWNDGLWHELGMTLDRVAGQKMYLDGVLVASGSKGVSAMNAGSRVWLGYSHDPSGSSNDYFTGRLDDLALLDYAEFQGGTICPIPPGIPDATLAEPCGTTQNTVKLTWGAIPDATSYEVQRSSVSCTMQNSFAPVATGLTATTFNDTTVSGGDPAVVYHYKVRSYSAETGMFSDFSSCQTCSPSGVCTLRPTFAGIGTAQSSSLAACANDLTWAPAASRCAVEGTGITYNVYRSTQPTFTPTAANRVASCLTDTSWHDDSTSLVSGWSYTYLVRAEDSTTAAKPYGAGGACNNGNEDQNSERETVETHGELRVATFIDTAGDGSSPDMEFPLTNWGFAWFDQHTPGGAQAYFSHSATSQCDALTTPVIDLRSPPEGSDVPTQLSFWTSYATAAGDGLVVEIATGPAFDTWTLLPGAAGVYTSTLAATNACGLPGGTPALGSTEGSASFGTWEEKTFALAAFHDQQVKIRFRLANGILARLDGGALLDDINITNANVPIGCAGAAPTPSCDVPPAFAGVSQVGAGANPTSLSIAWPAATPGCTPSDLRYNVYRSTAAPFLPSAANRIASCLDAAEWVDSGLSTGTVYSYVVRAEDVANTGSGPCGGLEDWNLAVLSAAPGAPRDVSTYDGFDGTGLSGSSWTFTGNWQQSTTVGHSGATSAYLPGLPGQCDTLTMNQWHALAPGVNTYLTFWTRMHGEQGFDGGYLEITADGTNWSRIAPEGGYAGNLVRSSLACTVPEPTAQPALSGTTSGTFRRYTFNLFAWNGQNVKVRLRWGSDATGTLPGAGLWIDDVAFEQEQP
jgi:hypothetical protein